MDLSKLTQNNQIAAGGALATLIAGFLPWFSYSAGGFGGANQSGFSSGIAGWLGILLVVAAGVIVAIKKLGMQDLAVQNLAAEQVAMVLGALGILLILLRFIFAPDDAFGIDVSRAWGSFVGLAASAATMFGVVRSAQDDGIAIPNAADFKDLTGGDDGSSDGGATTF